MERAAGPTNVRFAIARDEQGRALFVPWHPFSRAAYLLATPAEAAAVVQRVRLSLLVFIGVAVALAVTSPVLRLPLPLASAIAALPMLEWAWWTWRRTRGLERVRYEPPAAR